MAAKSQPPQHITEDIGHPTLPMKGPLNSKTIAAVMQPSIPRRSTFPEHVDPRARDHDGDDHLGGVREPNGEQVSDQDGKAEGSRLPVERQRHPQRAVGVPQGKMALMDLRPHQIRPRDEERNLVQERWVVDLDVRDLVESSALQNVVRPQEGPMGKSGHQNQHTCDYDHSQPQGIEDAPMASRQLSLAVPTRWLGDQRCVCGTFDGSRERFREHERTASS